MVVNGASTLLTYWHYFRSFYWWIFAIHGIHRLKQIARLSFLIFQVKFRRISVNHWFFCFIVLTRQDRKFRVNESMYLCAVVCNYGLLFYHFLSFLSCGWVPRMTANLRHEKERTSRQKNQVFLLTCSDHMIFVHLALMPQYVPLLNSTSI